jgi:hypothetical protein
MLDNVQKFKNFALKNITLNLEKELCSAQWVH